MKNQIENNCLFQSEYFSGLNWREAENLVGKVVEFSLNGDGWHRGKLKKIIQKDLEPYRYEKFFGSCYTYIRTTLETHARPTITITINDVEYKLPRPEIEAPEEGAVVFTWRPGKIRSWSWEGCKSDNERLSAGRIHLTEERAQAWADWWVNVVSWRR